MDLSLAAKIWDSYQSEFTAFFQDLLALETPPGGERAAAERVKAELETLGFANARIDRWGNVIAGFGSGTAGRVLLNAHIDIVSAGNPEDWTHPPFGGTLAEDRIYGRGACDTKSAVAAQVYTLAALKESGHAPAGELCVVAAVMEEVGGIGTLGYLEDEGAPTFALVGEPSDGCLMVGHRGRYQFEADIRGQAYHAAVDGAGVSPYPTLTRFLTSLGGLEFPSDDFYGNGSLEPTIVRSDNASPNVVPELIHLVLDCRTLPTQDAQTLEAELSARLKQSVTEGIEAELYVPDVNWKTWTGLERELPHVMPSFGTDREDATVRTAHMALQEHFSSEVQIQPWKFATDGGHMTNAGARVIGWGPGRQERAHTVDEFITLQELRAGLEGTMVATLALEDVLRREAEGRS